MLRRSSPLFFLPLAWTIACGGTSATTTTTTVTSSDGGTLPIDAGQAGEAGLNGDGPNPSGISIIVQPSDDRGAGFVTAINTATKSIHIELYLLTLESVVNALTAKVAAGLDVKVILNETFPAGSDTNATLYASLQSGKVPVVWASSAFTYTHEKTMIIDGATAYIMTSNMTESSNDSNREYVAVDTNAADVAEAEAIFEADYAMTNYMAGSATSTPTFPGPLVASPDPPMNSLSAIAAFISSAKTSVYAEVEEFDDSTIANAFASAAKAGANVNLALANTTDNTSSSSSVVTLKNAGGHVVVFGGTEESSTKSNPYLHAKAIVVDGETAWIGSENFTATSLQANRELGVFFSGPAAVSSVLTTIQSDVKSGTAL